jgi:hypothetical protein
VGATLAMQDQTHGSDLKRDGRASGLCEQDDARRRFATSYHEGRAVWTGHADTVMGSWQSAIPLALGTTQPWTPRR